MNRVKILRTEKGMRQIDLAQELKVAQSTLSGWENGQYEIDNENLWKLADLFECSIDYILGRSSIRNSNLGNNISVPEEFISPEDARKYVGMHAIFGSEGFRLDRMDDDEVLKFANELLRQMELISYKYKK